MPRCAAAGITVNALVIEGSEPDLDVYFWENVIIGEGAFIVTANGFEEYPAAIRRKLIRETTKQVAWLDLDAAVSGCRFVITGSKIRDHKRRIRRFCRGFIAC